MREIEAEIVGRDQAALLGDVSAEAVAQGGVKQVRRTVVGANGGAAFGVDRLVERVADLERAFADVRAECVEFAERLRCVLNTAFEAIECSQFSSIADLPAALTVKGRLVEHDGDGLALA